MLVSSAENKEKLIHLYPQLWKDFDKEKQAVPLPIADIWDGVHEMEDSRGVTVTSPEYMIENKFGADIFNNDQVQSELSRMNSAQYEKSKKHLLWIKPSIPIIPKDQRTMDNPLYVEMRKHRGPFHWMLTQYQKIVTWCKRTNVYPHICWSLESFKKKVDKILAGKEYNKPLEYFIKPSRQLPRMARQFSMFPRLGPELAFDIWSAMDEWFKLQGGVFCWGNMFQGGTLIPELVMIIYDTVGYRKKDGKPKVLGVKFINDLNGRDDSEQVGNSNQKTGDNTP
jgi:hypothetical protein